MPANLWRESSCCQVWTPTNEKSLESPPHKTTGFSIVVSLVFERLVSPLEDNNALLSLTRMCTSIWISESFSRSVIKGQSARHWSSPQSQNVNSSHATHKRPRRQNVRWSHLKTTPLGVLAQRQYPYGGQRMWFNEMLNSSLKSLDNELPLEIISLDPCSISFTRAAKPQRWGKRLSPLKA